MYSNGQIVHDLNTGRPCKVGGDNSNGSQWAWDGLPGKSVHYITRNPKFQRSLFGPRLSVVVNNEHYVLRDYVAEQEYCIALPSSIDDAVEKLRTGEIQPAPISERWLTKK